MKSYRKKDPKKVIGEIESVCNKHQVYNIEFVDNIVPMEYFDSFMPLLTGLPDKYNVFFETKANLTSHHFNQLAQAHIKWIQPGIENLNDNMLTLMDKGTTATINLRTLKYSIEHGIGLVWAILVGFPGEDIKWLQQLAGELKLFHHLSPPNALVPVVFQRFSKHLENPGKHGLNLKPFPSHKFIYPFDEKDLTDFTYYFCDDNHGLPPPTAARNDKYDFLKHEIFMWHYEFYKPDRATLIMSFNDNGIINIQDTRPCAAAKTHAFEGIHAAIIRISKSMYHQVFP